MKKTSFILGFCICWLSSVVCSATTPVLNSGGNNKVVYGSGKVITEERAITPFSKIRASNGIDVCIEQGSSHSLKVTADDNLLPYIRTEVTEGTLHVRMQEGVSVQNARQTEVYVKMVQIEDLMTTSGADIKSTTPLVVRDIRLTATSAGDIKLELDARHIGASATSGADITLKGKTESLKGNLSSGSDLKAIELKVQVCDITLTSGSDASVQVEESISYSVSSGADLSCKGHPKVTKAHVSSGGDVKFK